MTKARRSAAAKKAARTRKLNRKRSKKTKRRSYECPGTEATRRKDGKMVKCTKTHDVSSFYAAQKIAMSEGLWQKKLNNILLKNSLCYF